MFGERLRQLRQAKKLTQEELAAIAGVDRTSIGKYETTDTIPGRDVLLKFADYFNVSTDYLLGRDNEESDPPMLIIPEELEGVQVAFHRGEFEGLTQEEVDALAVIARTLKAQRLGDTKDDQAGSTL